MGIDTVELPDDLPPDLAGTPPPPEKKSPLRRILLIVAGLTLLCVVVCAVIFFVTGGISLLQPNRIVMGTADLRGQAPAPLDISNPEPTLEPPTEEPTPDLTATETPVPAVTPLPATATPGLPVSAGCVPPNERVKGYVVAVPDGGSVRVVIREKTYNVRYIGIQAPKFGLTPEPFGSDATRFNSTLLNGEMVILVKDVTDEDEAGNLLRYVFAGNNFVNLELARQGLAQAVSTAPDTSCDAELQMAQMQAQVERLGQWKDYSPTETPTLTPTIDLTALVSPTFTGVCDCKGPDLDCADFATRADAQACFEYCKKEGFGDIFLLDTGKDGYACITP
jgi:endonuclease YncB( thermonuclease family)